MWEYEQKLVSPDPPQSGDRFGTSVAIDGDAILIAKPSCGLDNNIGSGYVFRWNGATWAHEGTLTGSDAAPGDCVNAAALHGALAVIGAYFHEAAGEGSGSAYVFRLISGKWEQTRKLTASDAAVGDLFGYSVSVDRGSLLIGAPGRDGADTISGSAYPIECLPPGCTQTTPLTASDGGRDREFGSSVAINGNLAVVGSGGPPWGYLFRHDGSKWVEVDRFFLGGFDESVQPAQSVSIDGDYALVHQLVYQVRNGATFGDYAALQRCFGEGEGTVSEVCKRFDRVQDGVIDFQDYRKFLPRFTGP